MTNIIKPITYYDVMLRFEHVGIWETSPAPAGCRRRRRLCCKERKHLRATLPKALLDASESTLQESYKLYKTPVMWGDIFPGLFGIIDILKNDSYQLTHD